MKVHFIGIGGSGLAPIAILAKKMGFDVTGCDISKDTAYTKSLNDNDINVMFGHHDSHVDDADIVAVTPAIYDYDPNNKEVLKARAQNKLMTWQEFSGKYLQKGKKVIAISGTHGKSTTTSLCGEVLENAGLDPTVSAGTIIKKWNAGYRYGKSDYYVVEADEFNNNFLSYHPYIAVINNIEMDHPEFFHNFDEFKEAFINFIHNIENGGYLIANYDSPALKEVILSQIEYLNSNNIKLITYSKDDSIVTYNYKVDSISSSKTDFLINNKYKMGVRLIGEYNVQNAMAVYAVSKILGISDDKIFDGMMKYTGIERRLEFKGEFNGVAIYDDYAHHPGAVINVLKTLKEVFPNKRVLTIFEPHQISRLRLFIDEFSLGFDLSDVFIMTKTYEGREVHKHLKPVDFKEIQKRCKKRIYYIEDFNEVVDFVINGGLEYDIIVVFGAGYSYKLTNLLVDKFTNINN